MAKPRKGFHPNKVKGRPISKNESFMIFKYRRDQKALARFKRLSKLETTQATDSVGKAVSSTKNFEETNDSFEESLVNPFHLVTHSGEVTHSPKDSTSGRQSSRKEPYDGRDHDLGAESERPIGRMSRYYKIVQQHANEKDKLLKASEEKAKLRAEMEASKLVAQKEREKKKRLALGRSRKGQVIMSSILKSLESKLAPSRK